MGGVKMTMYYKTKYKNIRTETDGITFDSKAEARRYDELKLLLQSGDIIGFNRQPSFVLDNQGTRYRPDFIVADKNGVWVEDVKGVETPVFKLKRKMWTEKYPWLPLRIIR
jgi:dsDNA-binding SOS-regulon protein